MGIVRSLFGWMQASPARGDNPALYPLDFDELKKELSVVDEARRMNSTAAANGHGLASLEEGLTRNPAATKHAHSRTAPLGLSGSTSCLHGRSGISANAGRTADGRTA